MDKALEQYLNTVDRKLRPLPASERADIVREIKSAMQDMAADGLPTEGIGANLHTCIPAISTIRRPLIRNMLRDFCGTPAFLPLTIRG